jgi:hypothetical protein
MARPPAPGCRRSSTGSTLHPVRDRRRCLRRCLRRRRWRRCPHPRQASPTGRRRTRNLRFRHPGTDLRHRSSRYSHRPEPTSPQPTRPSIGRCSSSCSLGCDSSTPRSSGRRWSGSSRQSAEGLVLRGVADSEPTVANARRIGSPPRRKPGNRPGPLERIPHGAQARSNRSQPRRSQGSPFPTPPGVA